LSAAHRAGLSVAGALGLGGFALRGHQAGGDAMLTEFRGNPAEQGQAYEKGEQDEHFPEWTLLPGFVCDVAHARYLRGGDVDA
jgi:hypothetical protein